MVELGFSVRGLKYQKYAYEETKGVQHLLYIHKIYFNHV